MESNIVLWILLFVLVIAVLEGAVYLTVAIIRLCMWFKDLRRRREIDRRIISRAKGAGIWDKKPIVLGGRALELKAREDFKMKRAPGETDVELRRRYIEAEKRKKKKEEAKQEKRGKCIVRQLKAAGLWEKRPTPLGGRALELKAWEDFKIQRKPGETDEELRSRCMAAADAQYANTAEKKKEKETSDELPEICRKCDSNVCRNNKDLRESKAEKCKQEEEDYLKVLCHMFAEEESKNTPIKGGVSNGEQ